MSHPVQPEEVMQYLDGELPADRASGVMTHLEGCAECRAVADDLRSVSERLTAWQVEGPRGLAMPEMTAPIAQLRPRWSWRKAWWAAGVAAAGIVVLAVASLQQERALRVQQQTGLGVYRRQAPPDMNIPAAAAPPRAMEAGRDYGTRFKAVFKEAPTGPLIVRTAELRLTTSEFDATRRGLEDTLKRHHGYWGNMSLNAPESAGRTLDATARVPSDQLDALLTDCKKLGRVEAESQTGEDVSKQFTDLETRLANARNTEHRLTQLLADRTGKLSDVLAVETQISRVRGEIEEMEADRKSLTNRISYATLHVVVTVAYKAQLQVVPESTAARFRNAAVAGYRGVTDSLIETALFVVSYAPAAILWGAILFFPIRWTIRYIRRGQTRG